jgi:PAS domain S-box-containing protein
MKSKISWIKFSNWFALKPITTGLFVFAVLNIVTLYILVQRYEITKETKRHKMNTDLKVIHQNIDQSLRNCYTTTLSLALTIDDDGLPKDFETIGAQLMTSNSNIEAVQLVPDGIIQYTYPLKGNEKAIGLNLLTSKSLKDEALASILRRKMYFAGPLELVQGGQGIVGRLPVYNNNRFWGFSAVILKLDKLLKNSGVNAINSSEYYFQFSKSDPITNKEVFYLPEPNRIKKDNYVSSTIPDGNWKLYLIDKKPNSLYPPLVVPALLGLVVSLWFGYITFLLVKKPAELQILIKQQATKLFKSELQFKTIFEQAAIGMATVDPTSGNFLEINNKFCNLVGYTQEEMKDKNFRSITHPDDLESDLRNVKKIGNGKITEYFMEKRYFTKEGGIIWVNLFITPLLDKSNKVISAISIVEDITSRKQNEALIKKSENHFKSLFYDSPLPLREENFSKVKLNLKELNLMNEKRDEVKNYLSNNPDIVNKLHSLIELVNVNNACLILYKVNNKEELAKVKSSLFNDTSLNDFIEQLVAISQNEKQFMIDTIIKNSKQENRNISLNWNVIRGYEISLERIIVSNEDITNRKLAENIIINSQKKIQSLINTVDGIVWETDAEVNFTFISKKVETILGYTSEEWLASNNFWAEHIYPEDKDFVLNYFLAQTEASLDHDFEYRMVAKNGDIVWLRDIVNLEIDKNGKLLNLRGIMIDITKTKEIETQLNKSLHLVTEQNKRLLNFSYIVSHNLRSHTSNITSIIDFIATSESKEEIEHMVRLLKTVSNSLNETMLNLNEVVNIQTNIGLITENLNLQEYVDNAIKVLSDQIAAKDAIIEINIPPDAEIHYNAAYLESVLYNLISNAIRYNNPKKRPVVKISLVEEGANKILQVADNGIGIDLERNGDKIFGMYKTFTNNKDSKGIGLFITKNQIEAMGGQITIESELNQGTTFKINIV